MNHTTSDSQGRDTTMSSDIVERLREWAEADVRETMRDRSFEPHDLEIWAALMEEAADEIERLREDLERAYQKDDAKTREINLLVPENRKQAAEIERLRSALRYFLEDPRFDVAVGGNPNAVDAMLSEARAALSTDRGGE